MHYFAVDGLCKISTDNESKTLAVPALKLLIQKSNDDVMCCKAAISLGSIANDDESKNLAVFQLICFVLKSNREIARSDAIKNLGKIAIDSQNKRLAILSLIHLMHTSNDNFIFSDIGESLITISNDQESKSLAVITLIYLIQESNNKDTLRNAAWIVETILEGSSLNIWQDTIILLRSEVMNKSNETVIDKFKTCYRILWYCAQNIPYPAFSEAWHSPPIPKS